MNDPICSRVTPVLGLKVVAVVPVVTPRPKIWAMARCCSSERREMSVKEVSTTGASVPVIAL